jgi:hypothetical protein
MAIPPEEIPAAAMDHLAGLAAAHDIEIRQLIQSGGRYAFQIIISWNDTAQKWFMTRWCDSTTELVDLMTRVLEDNTLANIFKVGDLFQYLSAEMFIGTKDVVMTILRVEITELENQRGKQERAILYFKETAKGLVVGNKTNVRQLVKLFGAETDNWVDHRVALFTAEVTAFGKTMQSIRIRDFEPHSEKKQPKKGKAAQVELPETEVAAADNGDAWAIGADQLAWDELDVVEGEGEGRQ